MQQNNNHLTDIKESKTTLHPSPPFSPPLSLIVKEELNLSAETKSYISETITIIFRGVPHGATVRMRIYISLSAEQKEIL